MALNPVFHSRMKPALEPCRIYTAAEAAEHLRICKKTLLGILKIHPQYCAHAGRKIIISTDDLERLYEAMRPRPKSQIKLHPSPSEQALYRRATQLLSQKKRRKGAHGHGE